jgi:hypothetical protein
MVILKKHFYQIWVWVGWCGSIENRLTYLLKKRQILEGGCVGVGE